MDEYLIQGSTLTDIADAIREKTGDSALMTPAEMVEAIEEISGGGITPEYYEYTQSEALTTDATGNARIFSTKFLNHGYGLYRAVVENNGDGEYYAQRATLLRFGGTYRYIGNSSSSSMYGSFTRSNNTSNIVTPSNNLSFYLRAGAVIKVFHYPMFGEDEDFDFPS